MSIDYILDRVADNKFRGYKLNQINFYDNLNEMMLSVSQLKLCKDLGISRTNFSRWAKGTEPTIAKLVLLSDYLHCNIDDLLERE